MGVTTLEQLCCRWCGVRFVKSVVGDQRGRVDSACSENLLPLALLWKGRRAERTRKQATKDVDLEINGEL